MGIFCANAMSGKIHIWKFYLKMYSNNQVTSFYDHQYLLINKPFFRYLLHSVFACNTLLKFVWYFQTPKILNLHVVYGVSSWSCAKFLKKTLLVHIERMSYIFKTLLDYWTHHSIFCKEIDILKRKEGA